MLLGGKGGLNSSLPVLFVVHRPLALLILFFRVSITIIVDIITRKGKKKIAILTWIGSILCFLTMFYERNINYLKASGKVFV